MMYRLRPEGPQVLLIHPGGPFWAAKDRGAWSIPKGEIEEGEETLDAASASSRRRRGCGRRRSRGFPAPAVRRAQEQKDRLRMGVRGGFRPGTADKQHIHNGMAAALRHGEGVSGSGQGRVVQYRCSQREDTAGAVEFRGRVGRVVGLAVPALCPAIYTNANRGAKALE